jgi:hypothetical protein
MMVAPVKRINADPKHYVLPCPSLLALLLRFLGEYRVSPLIGIFLIDLWYGNAGYGVPPVMVPPAM